MYEPRVAFAMLATNDNKNNANSRGGVVGGAELRVLSCPSWKVSRSNFSRTWEAGHVATVICEKEKRRK